MNTTDHTVEIFQPKIVITKDIYNLFVIEPSEREHLTPFDHPDPSTLDIVRKDHADILIYYRLYIIKWKLKQMGNFKKFYLSRYALCSWVGRTYGVTDVGLREQKLCQKTV